MKQSGWDLRSVKRALLLAIPLFLLARLVRPYGWAEALITILYLAILGVTMAMLSSFGRLEDDRSDFFRECEQRNREWSRLEGETRRFYKAWAELSLAKQSEKNLEQEAKNFEQEVKEAAERIIMGKGQQ